MPPLETSARSRPWPARILTSSAVWSTSQPSGSQSVALSRMNSGFSAGHTSRIASTTSTTIRVRPAKSPP